MRNDRSTRRNSWLGLILSITLLALYMIAVTAYYFPKTYTLVIDETFQEEGSFTFIVECRYAQIWHVYARTDQRGTRYNITLIGYPIKSPLCYSSEPVVDETTAFVYNWTVRAHEPPMSAGYGYGFRIAPWNNYGDHWELAIQLAGSGKLQFTISSFDESNFKMFFYPDLLGAIGMLLIVVAYVYRLKLSKYTDKQ